jgi:hypothetical protein
VLGLFRSLALHLLIVALSTLGVRAPTDKARPIGTELVLRIGLLLRRVELVAHGLVHVEDLPVGFHQVLVVDLLVFLIHFKTIVLFTLRFGPLSWDHRHNL